MPIEVRNAVGPDEIAASYVAGQQAVDTNMQIRQQQRADNLSDKQALADDAQDRREEDFEFRYTAQQQREHDRLSESKATILAADYLTEEERQQAIAEIDAKQAGIKPVRHLKRPPVELGGRPEGQVFSQGGFNYTVEQDKMGRPVFKKLGKDASYETHQDRVAKFEAATKWATEAVTIKDKDGNEVDTGQKRFNKAKFDEAMRMMGGGPSETAQGQADDPEAARASRAQFLQQAKNENPLGTPEQWAARAKQLAGVQ